MSTAAPNCFDIRLHDRVVSVCHDGRILNLGDGERLPYRSVQGAIDLALKVIAARVNLPAAHDVVRAHQKGSLSLRFEGHSREVGVAVLHLHLIFGLARQAMAGLVPQTASRDECVYDTYHFGTDRHLLEAVKVLIGEWERLLGASATELERWRGRAVEIEDCLGYHGTELRPARIGVIGVTGAGKSSFVNAVLGRDLLPVHEEIATAVNTEIVWADRPQHEGVTVNWMTEEQIQARIEKERVHLFTLTTQEAKTHRDRKVAMLRAGLQASKTYGGRRLPLTMLPEVASVQRAGVAEAARDVRVYLHHPLLRHVTLVDTPGLRDPDEMRRRIAIEAAAKMDAWVYLAQGNDKENSSVVGDWKELREQAHNGAGVLILTKLDDAKDPVQILTCACRTPTTCAEA